MTERPFFISANTKNPKTPKPLVIKLKLRIDEFVGLLQVYLEKNG